MLRRTFAASLAVTCITVTLAGAAEQADVPPLHERIDALVEGANLGPVSSPASDAEFLRRAYLDLNGTIPDAAVARAFLEDTSPNKREALIDRLLARPQFARHMTATFDVMWMERRRQRSLPGREWTVSDEEWRAYLHKSFADNKPLDQLSREILGADGVDSALRPAVKFYLDRDGDPDLLARDIGRLFFGQDLQCAQCHDHPLVEDYLQADYYGLKAFVNRGVLFDDKKDKKLYYAENADGEVTFKSVFTGEGRDLVLPKLPQDGPMIEPVLGKEEAYVVAPAKDVRPIPKYSRRAQLAATAADGTNVAFNRNLANRLWAMMTGRGLAHPLDMQHSGNPAVQSELLAMLADELVKVKFDVKAFMREVALTRTYQRTSRMPSADELKTDAASGAAQLAAWKSEDAQIEFELARLETAAAEASTEVSTAYEKFAAAVAARTAAEKAHAEAKKTSDEVAAALAAAVNDSAAKEDILKALVEARIKADAAVAKLPDDKALADAAGQFKTRANEVDTQLAALRKTVKEKTPQVQDASLNLAAADKGLKTASAQAATTDSTLDAAEAKSRDERRVFRVAKARHAELTARIADAQAVLDYLALAETAAASRAASQAANEEYAKFTAQASAAEQSADAEQIVTAEQIDSAEQAGLAAAEKAAEDEAVEEKAFRALADKATVRFALASLKPLSPEQLAWTTMQSLGLVDQQHAALAEQAKKDAEAMMDLSPEERAAEEARLLEARTDEQLRKHVAQFVSLFGQQPGQAPTFQATVHQALFLANGSALSGWLNPGGNNLTERLSKLEQPDEVADELYITLLTRRATDDERQRVAAYWEAAKDDRAAAAREMVWALLASAEFRFNH